MFFKSGMTGKVISEFNSDVQSNYNTGDKLNGSIVMTIQQGDLIPNNTLINIRLLKNENAVASREITFNDFLAGQLIPISIVNSTDVCINMSVDNLSQVCENITIDNVVENCTLQLNENNETINVCVNESVSSVVENCTEINNPTVQQSCTTQNIANYYFNQEGSYSKNIQDLIDYTFTSSGNYVLRINSESLGINTEKIINVTGERQLGIMATVSITGHVFYLDEGIVMGANSSTNSSVNISGSVERPENQTYESMGSNEDNISPTVGITHPLNTTYNVNISAINYTASDNMGLSLCWYSNNSGLWNSSSVNAGINFTNVISKEGSNSWAVYCNDIFGNVGSSNIAFVKDTTSPIISLTSPLTGASYSGSSYNVIFVFDASDNSGVKNCSVYVNGNSYLNISAIVATNNQITASLSAGSYSAYVNCTDALNNIGNSSTITFTITAPATTTTPSYGGGTTALTSDTNKRFYDYTLGKVVRNVNYNLEIPVGQRNLIETLVGNSNNGNGIREDHYIELKEVNDKTAVIEIRSNPINVTFNIGDEKKFDLNNDMFYDLYVKLNGIVNKKTNLTIKNIHEELSAEDKGKVEENKTYVAEVNNTDQNREQPSGMNLLERLKISWKMFLIFVIIVVIILTIIIFYSVKMVNRKNEIIKLRKRR